MAFAVKRLTFGVATIESVAVRVPTRVSASADVVNVPSFVFEAGLPVSLAATTGVAPAGSRILRVDVAFGGAFYAIVDAEAAGIPIVPRRLPDLRAMGMAIAREVERLRRVGAPRDEGGWGE